MSIDYNRVYTTDKHCEILNRNNESLFVDYNDAIWLRTDETGAKIIKMCDGNKNLLQILESLAQESDFGLDVLKLVFEPFLQKVIDRGILVSSVEPQSHPDAANSSIYPSNIWLHVTEKCNLNCPFCYSKSNEYLTDECNVNSFLDFLRKIPVQERKKVTISGGEPLLFSKLQLLVEKLFNMGYKTTVITNGTINNHQYMNLLQFLDCIQVSLDGTNPFYNDFTRGEGSFKKTLESLKIIRSIGYNRCAISFTPNKHNIKNIPELPEFVFSNGLAHIHLTKLMPVGRGVKTRNALLPDDDEYNQYFNEFLKKYKKINYRIKYNKDLHQFGDPKYSDRELIGLTYSSNFYRKSLDGRKKHSCGLGMGVISIDTKGNVYPCACLMKPELHIGNIDHDNIQTILLNGRSLAGKLSVDCEKVECHSCKVRYFCGGGCRACALMEGDIHKKEISCDKYIKEIENTMWTYNH